jgi:hypothetical protein
MYSDVKLHDLGLVDGRVVIDEEILDALVELRQSMENDVACKSNVDLGSHTNDL